MKSNLFFFPFLVLLMSYLKGFHNPWGFPGGSDGKESACNAEDMGDMGSIPGSGRFPGGGNGNRLLYSCLANPMDKGAWWATIHKVANIWTLLST